jgi:hydrogenase expression/formation protein HypC
MCLAVPGEIISINESVSELRMAKVNVSGSIVDACVEWLPEAGVGDYVVVHVGMAIAKVEEKDAMEALEIFREMDELLQKEELAKAERP